MTHGSLVTIPSLVLAILSVSALAAAVFRSWRDAQQRRAEAESVRFTEARLRAQVRLLEVRLATLSNELEALRHGRALDPHRQAADPRRDPAREVEARPPGHRDDPQPRDGGMAPSPNIILFPGSASRRGPR